MNNNTTTFCGYYQEYWPSLPADPSMRNPQYREIAMGKKAKLNSYFSVSMFELKYASTVLMVKKKM